MRSINPSLHTLIDYAFCAVMALAPFLLRFGGTPATLAYSIAAGYFVFSAITDTPRAPVRMIPFRVHGAFELIAAPMLIAAPWLLRFDHEQVPTGFFVGAGVVTFVVFLLTDWRASPQPSTR